MKIFTHEQTQELLARLRAFRAWVADSEYRAEVKTPEIMEGIADIEKAERFIADLDAAVTGEADRLSFRWAAAEEQDNFENLPVKKLHFKADNGQKS